MPENPNSNTPQPVPGGGNQPQPAGANAAQGITPEMVNAIADKVFARLLLELKYERERRRFTPHSPASTKGGR